MSKSSPEDLRIQIARLKEYPHCENCGAANPEFIAYTDDSKEGFTSCCNQALCRGEEEFIFGSDTVTVRGCCWAMAERQFHLLGIEVLDLKSIRRCRPDDPPLSI